MDKKELGAKLGVAIETAENWAVDGWRMTFGNRDVEISSLKKAEESPMTFVYREEAVSYWRQIDEMGQETAAQGKKAMAALDNDDLKAAADAVYFARFIEKRINKETPTWGPITDELMRRADE